MQLSKVVGHLNIMKLEKTSIFDLLLFAVAVTAFLLFGQFIGWRVVGIFQLIFAIKIIREKAVGVGWEGFEPSSYLRGLPAILIGVLSLCLAVMLLFFPEQTIMKWST